MTQPPQSGGFNPEEYERQIRQAQEQAQQQYQQYQQQAQPQQPGQPFQQQPQQPGQPFGQQPGQPFGQQPQQFAEEQPKKAFPVRKVISGVIAIGMVAVGGYFLVNRLVSNAALKEGECLTFSGESNNAEHKSADCADANTFSYRAVKVHDAVGQICGPNEVKYEYSSRGRFTKAQKTVCLEPNFHAGKCYEEVTTIEDFKVVDCSSEAAMFKIASVAEGTTAECPEGADPFPYTTRTYCVELP